MLQTLRYRHPSKREHLKASERSGIERFCRHEISGHFTSNSIWNLKRTFTDDSSRHFQKPAANSFAVTQSWIVPPICGGFRAASDEVRCRHDLWIAGSQHWFCDDERAHCSDSRGERKRTAHSICRVSQRRSLEVGERRNHVQAGFRSSIGSVDWSARD